MCTGQMIEAYEILERKCEGGDYLEDFVLKG
jgi:hypothetical protein